MSTSSDYDLIIIGTGPDSGTLVCTLVPSEKKSLLLERGGYPPREKYNYIHQQNESCQCRQVCLHIEPREAGSPTQTSTKEYWNCATLVRTVVR